MNVLDGLTRISHKNTPIINPVLPDAPCSGLKIKGKAKFQVVGPDELTGEIVTKQETPWMDNILTSFGLASLASAVGSSAAVTASNWVLAMAIGTSATAPTSSDTALNASTASVALTLGAGTGTHTNLAAQTVEYQATFASTNTSGSYTINEVGLFCQSSSITTQMAAHATLATAVIKGASDVVNVSYDIIFTTS